MRELAEDLLGEDQRMSAIRGGTNKRKLSLIVFAICSISEI